MGIEYVIAPMEADAQLAFLESKGLIQGVITEDSDLLAFGCKEVLYNDTCAWSVAAGETLSGGYIYISMFYINDFFWKWKNLYVPWVPTTDGICSYYYLQILL